MISTRSVGLLIDTVVCLSLAKWETVSGRFGGYFTVRRRKRLMPPIGGRARKSPAVRRWQMEAIVGEKRARPVPLAQLDSSSGFLIRRSQVRILPGTPIKSTTYANRRKHVAAMLQSNNYKHFQRLPRPPGGSMQHECDMAS